MRWGVWYSRGVMTMAVRVLVAFLTFAALLGASAGVRAAEPERASTISVSAEAVIAAEAERAEIELGVVTEAKTAQAAAAQNAQKQDTTIARLRALLGPKAQIRTVNYSLTPQYAYPKDGRSSPTLSGYSASNTVRVTLDDLSVVGKVIDAATESGANTIQQLTFTLRDPREAVKKALAQAAADARAKADTIAAALGLKIMRVLQAEEGGAEVRPRVMMQAKAAFERSATPIEPGSIDIRATVALTVEVSR